MGGLGRIYFATKGLGEGGNGGERKVGWQRDQI